MNNEELNHSALKAATLYQQRLEVGEKFLQRAMEDLARGRERDVVLRRLQAVRNVIMGKADDVDDKLLDEWRKTEKDTAAATPSRNVNTRRNGRPVR